MSSQAWKAVTDFGDSALLLPCVLLVALWLFASLRSVRVAAVWLGYCGLAVAIIALTRLAYMGWHIGIPGVDFTGLSGHTTLSFLVWLVLLFLMLGRSRVSRVLALAGGIILASLIAVSRIEVHSHSLSEVIGGAVVGISLSAIYLRAHRRLFPLRLPRSRFLVTLMVPLLLGYGRIMPSEHMLRSVSVALSGHGWVYTRHDARELSPPSSQ